MFARLIYAGEGVLVAKKDFNLPKHNEIDTKNLYVFATLKKLDRFESLIQSR